ncbi:MAG: hypothetical protein JWO60_1303 [Frankiales bacterium]|nr:hypothetical protein [Frankiales bacterium]
MPAALALLLLAACTSSGDVAPSPRPTAAVPVPVPTATAPLVVSSCAALLRAVPQELGDGLRRREVTGDPLRTAAWGDPAVTLECGVPRPERPEPPVEIGPNDDGPLVAFTTRDVGAGTRFTTSDRAVTVAVTVPDVYDSQVLVTLAGALRALPTPSPAPGG